MSTTLSRFFVFAFATAWLASSICVYGLRPTYLCVVPFYTRGASQTTYGDFIQKLRYEMGSQATIYGIPQLREASSWTNADRYVQVTLYNSAGASITLAIDKVNVNLVGYRAGYDSYIFPSQHGPQTSNLFAGTKRYLIQFNETYSSMEKSACTTRKSINLGMGELDKAIQDLYDKKFSASASSLLIITQMIPEAVRYRQEVMSTTLSRFFVFAFATAWLASSICVYGLRPTYLCVVPFYTRGASQTTYGDFIQKLRYEMGSQATIYGIPQLREASSWTNADRYVQVTLYNSAGASITLAIDKVNVNLVGYRAGYDSYIFPSQHGPQTSNLFAGTKRYLIQFNETYSSMEKSACTTRKSINLGMGELDKAIQDLYDKKFSASASSLLIITQMIPEAVRYRYIEKLVLQYISDVESHVFLPTAAMIAYEDNWISLCNRITNSIGGLIYPPFMLPDGSNQEVPITSVFLTLRLNIGVILFFCHPPTSIPPFASTTCQNIPEYTVMIRGRNKYCVDVELNNFHDGDSIILYPCKSLDKAANQLWTIKKDGSIQSGGKCLYASGLTAGQYVHIHNCSTAPVPDATKWKINDNGNIENLKYELVLSAFSGSMYSKLTLEKNTYASSQGWRLGNNTEPVVTPIIGYQSMCMQITPFKMAECSNTNLQKWELYPDGTVRPMTNTSSCITSIFSQVDDTSCSGGSGDRWLFNLDGSISDAANKHVLQVNETRNIVTGVRSADSPTDRQTWSISTL